MSKWTARSDNTALLTPAAVIRWSVVFVEMKRLSLYFYLGRSIELAQSDKNVLSDANNSSWVTDNLSSKNLGPRSNLIWLGDADYFQFGAELVSLVLLFGSHLLDHISNVIQIVAPVEWSSRKNISANRLSSSYWR